MKSTCKHCGFTWEKGTDSGHTKDDCIERLKAEIDELNEQIENMSKLLNSQKCKLNSINEGFGRIKFELTDEQVEFWEKATEQGAAHND